MQAARYFVLPLLLVLTACAGGDEPKMQGVNRTIDVVPQQDGSFKAVGPKCPEWDDSTMNRLNNDPLPQLGCATSNNLAKMIADPADLVRDKTKANKQVVGDGEALSNHVRGYRRGALTIAPTAPSASAGGTQ